MTISVFISHSTEDDPAVKKIRESLELHRIKVWTDSRELTTGDLLESSITEAIDQSSHLIALLSLAAVKSRWVRKEIEYALKGDKKIKVIPLLIDPVDHDFLHVWFDDEPVGQQYRVGPGGIERILPDLLAALGMQQPNDPRSGEEKPNKPVADLILELSRPTIKEIDGIPRASAEAQLIYHPADGSPEVKSKPYPFTAPIGAIEADDLRWYLEHWAMWPSEHFKKRADEVEANLPEWGKRLYEALDQKAARTALEAWRGVAQNGDISHRFTVLVDAELIEGSDEATQTQANESATKLLALPWELLHNDHSFLFQRAHGVRVRRQLPNREPQPLVTTNPPIRILMLSPRPEDDRAGYIDHRVSARPVVEALAPLGELVQLDVLTPPTFKAMTDALQKAHERKAPYHVVHFDGHGIYNRQHGLGALCFEDIRDSNKLTERRTDLVAADKIATALTNHRVPLFSSKHARVLNQSRIPPPLLPVVCCKGVSLQW